MGILLKKQKYSTNFYDYIFCVAKSEMTLHFIRKMEPGKIFYV